MDLDIPLKCVVAPTYRMSYTNIILWHPNSGTHIPPKMVMSVFQAATSRHCSVTGKSTGGFLTVWTV